MKPFSLITLAALCFFATAARAQDSAEVRTWTDSTGKFKIAATFVKFEAGKVHLKRKDNGQPLVVPVGKLSAADQAIVRKILASKKPASQPSDPATSNSSPAASAPSKMVWEGGWNNRKFGTKGPLVCNATIKDDKTWNATFTGTGIGKPFKYVVMITTSKKGNQTVLQGTSMLDGDRYTWSGYVEGEALYGRYRSAKGNNGEFQLKVPKNKR